MTSLLVDELAFRFPRRQGDCSCIICTRAGTDPNKSASYTDPPPVFVPHKLLKFSADRKMMYELVDDDIHELEQKQQQPPATQPTPTTPASTKAAKDKAEANVDHAPWTLAPTEQVWAKSLHKLLKSLLKDKRSVIFAKPVDPVALNIPDYFNIIKHPMDLGTVLKRLEGSEPEGYVYEDPEEAISDVRMVFRNAFTCMYALRSE